MGMDVYGKKPTSEEGEYFRNNMQAWGSLAEYINEVAPDIAIKCEYWHGNDGDGLDAANALKLAETLQAEVDSGRCELRERARASVQEGMPTEPCPLCDGTGRRKPGREAGAGDFVTGIVCVLCGGRGRITPWSRSGWFSVRNVQDFVAFLRGSGGFEIW
jgi:hypothetical protein